MIVHSTFNSSRQSLLARKNRMTCPTNMSTIASYLLACRLVTILLPHLDTLVRIAKLQHLLVVPVVKCKRDCQWQS